MKLKGKTFFHTKIKIADKKKIKNTIKKAKLQSKYNNKTGLIKEKNNKNLRRNALLKQQPNLL